MPDDSVSRREFLAASMATGAVVAASCSQGAERAEPAPDADVAQGRAGRVIDCHAHLTYSHVDDYLERDRQLIDAADRLGIDQLCCSILTPKRPSTLEGFRRCNTLLAEAMKRFSDRVLGYCYVNPGYGREAVDEIRRCVEQREFIGVKLYNAHVCTERTVFPVIETAIDLKVPVLHHAGHRHRGDPRQPNISDAGDLAELASRYPEARLICAHITGGGDWEWAIKAARRAENVYLDTSGSVTDEGSVEMAVRYVGADRVLFGCDNSMTAGVGKMLAARLGPEEKQKILGRNMMRLLSLRG